MGKKRSATQKLAAAGENNGGSGVLLPGSTLEDYFHSKKFSDTGGLGQVSKHLLVGTPTNNAMAMEKEDVEELKATPERSLHATDKDAGAGGGVVAESKDASEAMDDEATPGSKASGSRGHHKVRDDDADKEIEADERHSNHDEYEDDYESDSPDHTTTATSVAGMTLSDYLQAKETGSLADDDNSKDDTAKHAPTVKKHELAAAPKSKAVVVQPSIIAKKAAPPALISGMSLDHYLGASSSAIGDEDDSDGADSDADSKSPTSKRKKSKAKVGAKPLLTISKQTTASGAGAAQEEYVTPFQKRLTKKVKAKTKQQQTGNSASISKSILLAEAPTSSSSSFSSVSLQTKSIPLNGSSSLLKDAKEKKKLQQQQYQQQQHGHTHSQPPLPKLVASSSSVHSLLHSKEHQHDADGNGSEDDERLPPLAHY